MPDYHYIQMGSTPEAYPGCAAPRPGVELGAPYEMPHAPDFPRCPCNDEYARALGRSTHTAFAQSMYAAMIEPAWVTYNYATPLLYARPRAAGI